MILPDLEIIKLFRKKAGITQKELSKITGLSQSYINKIENLLAEPPYNVAKKIIEVLDNLRNTNEDISVKKLMTKIKTINSEKKIKDAIKLMDDLNVSQLPVVSDGLIVGSITKRTIPKLVKKGLSNINELIINDVMEPSFPMIPENSKIQLVSLLLEYNDAVLLLNKGKFSGIITRHDLIKLIQK